MSISKGKWTKFLLMSKDERLLDVLPDTRYFEENALWEMLDKYKQVMLKPNFGCQGLGIIQVTAMDNEEIELHIGHQKVVLQGKESAYEYLKQNHLKKRNPRYIIQRKIPLAQINLHPFDIRVMVQRKRDSSEWTITGKLAKVAASHFVVTNVAQAVLTVEEAIERSSLNNKQKNDIVSEMERISLLVVQELAKSYPDRRTYGLDIGIDQAGKIWVIEANLNPAIAMFRKLTDGSYGEIRAYRRG